MDTHTSKYRVWFCLVAALVGMAVLSSDALAARGKKKKEEKKSAPVFYPPAPEEPRIQFLRTFSTEKDLKTESSRFKKFIVGQEDSFEVIGKPYGVAMHDGQIFICESVQNFVRILNLNDNTIGHLGRTGQGKLAKPINIAIDSDGTRYVVDTSHKRIMVYDADNVYTTAFGNPETMSPVDVAVLGDDLYVCDVASSQIVILDKKTGEEIRRFGEKGTEEGQLYYPTNLAVDPDANVFVADSLVARVLRFDSRDNFTQQFGSMGRGLGQFTRPKGIAIDREGRLYVVDSAFENVQIFDRDGNLLMYFGGPGGGPGNMVLPAKVSVSYDGVDLFADYVAPDQEIEYLILVSCQFGQNMLNVYGFLKKDE